jgi:NAD(P)-dependent dehydrogenase (short-subunit alcohol dehydrogenase family)
MRLRDKIALITGGTTGIGAATARLFDSEGAKVIVTVRGLYFITKHSAPVIPNGGSIIFTGSTAGSKGGPGMSVYSATKAAVRSLARTLAAELAPRNVRVNVISPGVIETPILAKVGLTQEQLNGWLEGSKQRIPLGRIGAGRRKWPQRRCILPRTPHSPRERNFSWAGAMLTSDATESRWLGPPRLVAR